MNNISGEFHTDLQQESTTYDRFEPLTVSDFSEMIRISNESVDRPEIRTSFIEFISGFAEVARNTWREQSDNNS
jgi:hypothetical protein